MLSSRFANHRLALLPSALFGGAIGSGASWVSSIENGCCRLGAELTVSVSSDRRSWRVPQSPELGDLL